MKRPSQEAVEAVTQVFCYVIGAAVCVMGLFDIVPWKAIFESVTGAAWAQAIGSLGAIGAAIYVARAAMKEKRLDEMRTSAMQRGNAVLCVNNCVNLAEHMAEAVHKPSGERLLIAAYGVPEFEEALLALRSLPTDQIHDPKLTGALLRARGAFAVVMHIRQLIEVGETTKLQGLLPGKLGYALGALKVARADLLGIEVQVDD